MHRYQERWGDMNVPRRFWEDWALGIWVSDVRAASGRQWLNPTQTQSLEDLRFPFKVPGVSMHFATAAHRKHHLCKNIAITQEIIASIPHILFA